MIIENVIVFYGILMEIMSRSLSPPNAFLINFF